MPKGIRIIADRNQIRNLEQALRRRVAAEAFLAFADRGDDPGDFIARDVLPARDLDVGANNNWNGTDQRWEQSIPAGFGAPGDAEVYQIDRQANAEDKIIGFLVIRNATSGSSETTEIRWQLGGVNGDIQGTIDDQQVEGLLVDDEVTGLMAEAIVFEAQEEGTIEQFVLNSDVTERIIYEGAVGEREDNTFGVSPEDKILQGENPDQLRNEFGSRAGRPTQT